MGPRDHWPRHARQWELVGAPLRPTSDDVAIAEADVAAWCIQRGRAPRALLLGVTPELATMRWPDETSLIAVDRSQAMIEHVFPKTGERLAIAAEWLALPLAARTIDVALGDGCLSTFEFPAAYRAFAVELRRVLAADGVVMLRLFAAPEQPETLAAIASDLRTGAVGNLHVLKWRIAMAIQPATRNIPVVEIWRAFEELVADRAALGWDPAVFATIDVYRDSDLVYSFPTVAEVRAAFDAHFVEVACRTPRYELGDRCPTLVLELR